MLCPNELGCLFARTLVPPTNGAEKLYENIEGKFQLGDLCSYKIAIPTSTDLNDIMYMRIEYLHNAKATMIKGNSLLDPIYIYQLTPGHDFSATKGINFFLLFEATNISSGDFVFKIWYRQVAGSGKTQPTRPDYPPGWVDPSNPNNFVEDPTIDNEIPEEEECEGEDCDEDEKTDGEDGDKDTDTSTECFKDEANCEEKAETIGGGNSGGINKEDDKVNDKNDPWPDGKPKEPVKQVIDDNPNDSGTINNFDPFGLDSQKEVHSETE